MKNVKVDGFYDDNLIEWSPHEPGVPFEFGGDFYHRLIPMVTFRPVDPANFFMASTRVWEGYSPHEHEPEELIMATNAIAVYLFHYWDKKSAAKLQRLVDGDDTAQDEILIPDESDPTTFAFAPGIHSRVVVEGNRGPQGGRRISDEKGVRLAAYLTP